MTPRSEYPRPDFVRDSFFCLNGEWDFSFDEPSYDMKITVPYTFEWKASGIGERSFHKNVFYRKSFTLPPDMRGKRVLLHFGAVDYICRVYLNGVFVREHVGGETPFCIDVTDEIKEQNVLTVAVTDDPFDLSQPRGKQYWKEEPEEIFYPRTTGIWQSVWLEAVGELYIASCRITPLYDRRAVLFEYDLSGKTDDLFFETDISFEGTAVASVRLAVTGRSGSFVLPLDENLLSVWKPFDVITWSPEDPRLFDVVLRLRSDCIIYDKVSSYFGMRKVSVENGIFMLNGRPYYQKLVLDQGYWRDSGLTAPDDEAFIRDITMTKQMGFNGVRKHQKVEDPRYLYHADRLGLLVWGESASAYVFSRAYVKNMYAAWQEIVERDYNHPCIVAWTPLNEGWGVQEIATDRLQQAHADALVSMIKSLDGTRIVNDSDGWMHTTGDLLTVHDYAGTGEKLSSHFGSIESILKLRPCGRPMYADGYGYRGQPVLVSEFGGIKYSPSDDSEKAWGYCETGSEDAFLAKYAEFVNALYASPEVQGFCYTQLTDVEQEQNGLVNYDRSLKLPLHKIKEINDGR